jgi:hypothetical protein
MSSCERKIARLPRPKGASLATTIVFAGLALMLGLALASTSVTHLQFANNQTRGLKARAAAEAVLAVAIERVVKNREFGHSLGIDSSLESVSENGVGRLTFDAARASAWDIPVSLNNSFGSAVEQGWEGRTVPVEAVHLVAVGEAQGMTKIVEAVLEVPKYPYALASSGPVETRGDLLVGGVSRLEDAFSSLAPEDLDPADLVSNAPGVAVSLAGEAFLSGNVRAVGEIELGGGVTLHGEVQPHSSPLPLAEVDWDDIQPDISTPFTPTRSPVVSSSQHFDEPELSINGGLTLDQGLLSVNGDLVIHGGVRGKGALLVNGSVEIQGGAALTGENQIALVATDDVIIHGDEQNSSFFQGLIYTEGDLKAQNVTLLGTFVANGPQTTVDPGSRLSLENVRAIHHDNFTDIDKEIRVIYQLYATAEGSVDVEGGTVTPPRSDLICHITADAENATRFQELLEDRTEFDGAVPPIQLTGDLYNDLQFTGPDGSALTFLEAQAAISELHTSTPEFRAQGNSGPPQALIQPLMFEFDLNEYLGLLSRNRIIFWKAH